MTDVYFYHLEQQPLEKVLPRLLVATLERGWRAVIQAGSEDRCEALSSLLWTFDEAAFVPHGTAADGRAALQPIWLTPMDENPNSANVRFFVDGARPAAVDGLERAMILFDGADESAVTASREDWKRFKAEGHAISYWQQDEGGRWQNRAGG
ncbi:MAG: DNA polymerase III subunit chi [Rhizobiales bacterium]|nr:DNA polymerase III subunit chi [Hyphomicrobiales bacterium]